MTAEKSNSKSEEVWEFNIYVSGNTGKSRAAINNLTKVCEEHLKGRYHIVIIDLDKTPGLGEDDKIFALPTVIRKLPLPLKRLIGDLSQTEKVLAGLDIPPKDDQC